jgi:hypothetical protein
VLSAKDAAFIADVLALACRHLRSNPRSPLSPRSGIAAVVHDAATRLGSCAYHLEEI